MGQEQVLEYLRGKDWKSIKDISKALGITESAANNNISRMGIFLEKKQIPLSRACLFKIKGDVNENKSTTTTNRKEL